MGKYTDWKEDGDGQGCTNYLHVDTDGTEWLITSAEREAVIPNKGEPALLGRYNSTTRAPLGWWFLGPWTGLFPDLDEYRNRTE